MRSIFVTRNREKDNVSVYEQEPAVVVTCDRADLPYLKSLPYANNSGVYILIGNNMRYVGQTAGQTINRRLAQHNQNSDKAWFKKIIFFGRTDNHLTKTQAEYLEKKFVQYYSDDDHLQLMNGTVGNSGYIDRLSTIQADELWNSFFDILEDVANIDLLSVNNGLVDETLNGHLFVQFDHQTISDGISRQVLIKFVRRLLKSSKYREQLLEFLVDDKATSKNILGRQQNVFPSGQEAAFEIEPDIFLYVNLSKKGVSKTIQKIAGWLGLTIEINF
ncbi:GIY-YIG nuclease family protein [Furfurilactobacillus entadae]|uniref:GIY-YIG nuclease family protein n=1 Tax=Furfurilactobacillus entadae TaxID=2922307 RepID=UPI0035E620FF